jgi:thiamine biosynthesis lipoprotein ApbE
VDSPAMKKLQFISGIKFMLLCMQQSLKRYADEIEQAEEYVELVDQFYQENRKLMTINQYKAAKRDSRYFVSLIEEMSEYYKQKSKNR